METPAMPAEPYAPRLLMLATLSCAYPGADAVGKARLEYYPNVHVVGVPAPVMFPKEFYLRTFARGFDGIIVAACGSDCPSKNAYERLAERIDELVQVMKHGGLEIPRIRLTALCTVCIKSFLKEVDEMRTKLSPLGPVNRGVARRLWQEERAAQEARAVRVA